MQAVNSDWGPETVCVKYLEAGHTFMAADNIHAVIGKKMKHVNEIIDFRDLIDLVSSSTRKVKVVTMQVHDFYPFRAGNRARSARNVTLPMLHDISEVYFARGSRLMFYKTSHADTEYQGVDFLRTKFNVEKFPTPLQHARGISGKKREGIIKLLAHVDGLKRKFYKDLPINEKAKDLVFEDDA